MSTYTITPGSVASTSSRGWRYAQNRAFSGSTRPEALSVPESQRYFWSPEWQRLEAQTTADIAAGRTRRFSNARDAARWLLSDDD